MSPRARSAAARALELVADVLVAFGGLGGFAGLLMLAFWYIAPVPFPAGLIAGGGGMAGGALLVAGGFVVRRAGGTLTKIKEPDARGFDVVHRGPGGWKGKA